MSKITDIDSARPHITNSIECKGCDHKWVAVYPERTNHLECPNCHEFVNELGTIVSVNICKVCKREFSVCPLADWDECLADDCKSYDPDRDADKLFD